MHGWIDSKETPAGRFPFVPILCGVAYLALTVCYSFMIPAWEANDELDHVANIEYEIRHFGAFIPIAYERWHETHQPPLYYWIGAAWQRLLRIPAFDPSFPPWRATKPENDKLVFAHEKFSSVQRKQALVLHQLRLLAPILGLITVGLTFLICRSVTRDPLFAGSATFIVALHPKFLILSAVITNDSLAVLLGSALLWLIICYVSESGDSLRRPLLAFATGLVAGAGVLTKLSLLPLIGLLIPAAIFLSAKDWRRKTRDLLLIAVSSLLVCGWWLLHNRTVYGDWLAMRASNHWLALRIPKTVRAVSFLDVDRFLNFVPQTLFRTFWYDGGFNQLVAPFAVYGVLWLMAAVCLGQAFKAQLINKTSAPGIAHAPLLWLAALAGVLAVLLIAQQTLQAEGRIAFVALPAFAILLTSGSQAYFTSTRFPWLGLSLWPFIIISFNAYLFLRFVLPHRQL